MAIPFLPSVLSSRTSSAQALFPRQPRFIQIVSDHSIDRLNLSPLPADHVHTTPVTHLDDVTKRQALSDIWAATGQLTPAMSGAAWEPLVSHMNIIAGSVLSSGANGHNAAAPTCFSGVADGGSPFVPYSVDHVIQQKLARPDHAFPSLRNSLYYARGQGYFHLAYKDWCFADGEKLPAMYDIAELEAALGGVSVNTDADAPPDPRIEHRKKLIDVVKGQYEQLVNHPRLSSLDKERLQAAIDLWNDAVNRSAAVFSCDAMPEAPTLVEAGQINYRVFHEYAMDLLSYALACDMTPVVSYVLPHGNDDWPNSRSEHGTMHACQHGNQAENPGAWDRYQVLKPWRLARVAHFANRLREITDVTGESLLDNSLIHYGQEYSQQGQLHRFTGFISLLFGGAAGRLNTDNFLDVYGPDRGDLYFPDAQPYNRTAITMLKALGLSDDDYESVTGQVGFGEYADKLVDEQEHGGRYLEAEITTRARLTNEGRARYLSDAEKRKAFPILTGA